MHGCEMSKSNWLETRSDGQGQLAALVPQASFLNSSKDRGEVHQTCINSSVLSVKPSVNNMDCSLHALKVRTSLDSGSIGTMDKAYE